MKPRELRPKADWTDFVAPPVTITVMAKDHPPKPLLYRADGTPLIDGRTVGFKVSR